MQSGSRLTSSTATSFFTGSFDLEEEAKVLEDYVVGQRLGEGAYGSVYVVKYIPSGDRFALKILQKQDLFTGSGIYSPLLLTGDSAEGPPRLLLGEAVADSSPLGDTGGGYGATTTAAAIVRTFEQKIISEAMVMQALEHPHVVKFYKFLNSTTAFYFVMELAEGGELFDLILSKQFFAEDEARMYFQQLISAIDYCHRNGVAHKDLKAENLLLSNDGRLLVCDFGFSSKVVKENIDDPEETVCTADNVALLDAIHNGAMFGTLHYTSPEAVVASAQQHGYDCLSSGDTESGRNDDVWPDARFTDTQSAFASPTGLTGGIRSAGVGQSSSTPSSTPPTTPASSRSGSSARHQLRRHVKPTAVADAAHEQMRSTVEQNGTTRGASCIHRHDAAMQHAAPNDGDVAVGVQRTAKQSSSSSPRLRDGRDRPTLLTPPPSACGAGNLRHSSSTHSLSSTTHGHSKQCKSASPTSGLNKVGETFSTFMRSLLGTSGNGHHHHHHASPHHPPHQRTAGAHGRAGSPRDKLSAELSGSPASTTAVGRPCSRTPRGIAAFPAGGSSKPCEVEEGTAGALTPLKPGISSQEPISVLSSAVSSSASSPSSSSFFTNPSFADSAGRAGASATAPLAVRGALPISSASPITRCPTMTVDGASLCRHRAPGKDMLAAPLPTDSSAEEVRNTCDGLHRTGTDRINPSLPPNARSRSSSVLDTIARDGGRGGDGEAVSSEVPAPRFSRPRKPQPVIVDPFQQDLWSAGVILFFMLTGRLPFDGRDEEETLHLIQVNEFAFDDDELRRISPAARQLVTDMLAAEPTDRPTVEQIIDNPWFRVGIQIGKDFPHREDLREDATSPLYSPTGNHLSGRTRVDGASSSALSSNAVHVEGGNEMSGSPTVHAASNFAGSTSRAHGSGGVAALARPHSLPAEGEIPVTVVPPATAALHASEAAAETAVALERSDSNPGARGSCSSVRRGGAGASTFLDFSTQHPVSVEEERVLETAFRKVDSDGFGCITRDQLRDMLTTLHGDEVHTNEVDELVRLFTGDAHADKITFKQFREAWVSKDLAHTPFTHSSEFQLANIIGTEMDAVEQQVVRQLRSAFDSLDENHRGVIQLDQIRRVFEKCHIPVQREDCLSLIKYFHEMEMNRCQNRTSLNRQAWRTTPAVTPTTATPAPASGAGSPLQSRKETSLMVVPPASQSAGEGSAKEVAGLRAVAEDGCRHTCCTTNAAVNPAISGAKSGGASNPVASPVCSASGSRSPTHVGSPVPFSHITVSFDSFVYGIVKNDILLKHPLGRKLAAATNLAALFQSRNVTECVRHGFLVTGLQNVILTKLASLPERLLLLYSDKVVSNTENIYSFRYLGSSALVVGATMSSATPLLMSSSLVAMPSSNGPAGGALTVTSAQGTPSLQSSSGALQRLSTPSVSSFPRRLVLPNLEAHGSPSSQHRISNSQGIASATWSRPEDTPVTSPEMPGASSSAGAPIESANLAAPAVDTIPLRSNKPLRPRPPLSSASTQQDFPEASGSPQDERRVGGQGDSSGSLNLLLLTPQRSAAVPVPRPPSHSGNTATPRNQPASTAIASGGGVGTPLALSHSLAISFSHSVNQSPQAAGLRRGSRGLRELQCHTVDNDADSAQDDTNSFFSASRRSSSIMNTSEDSQSASSGAHSSLLGDEQEALKSAAALRSRRRTLPDHATPRASADCHKRLSGCNTRAQKSTAAVDGKKSKCTSSKAARSEGSLSSTPLCSGCAIAPDARGSPSQVSASSPPASSSWSLPRRSNTETATVGENNAAASTATAAPVDHHVRTSLSTLSASFHTPSPAPHAGGGGFLQSAPSTTFAHRAMAYGGTGAVAQVNGVCDIDVILSPACLGYTMVQFRRIHGKTSDFHEAVSFTSNLLELEREQAMEDTLTRGESELM